MIRDSIDEMIGIRTAGDLSKAIKKTIAEEVEVCGVYDLINRVYSAHFSTLLQPVLILQFYLLVVLVIFLLIFLRESRDTGC